jgi:pimeloyl-ACP methyl ester carboxylesterase
MTPDRVAAVVLLVAAVAACERALGHTFPAWLRPCTLQDISGPALCGRYEVRENRSGDGAGRKISLRIIVLPARAAHRAPDPIFYLAGGPGGAATEDASWLVESLPKIFAERDIVLVDQRGTGGSNPLDCDFGATASEAGTGLFPVAAVRACRSALAGRADLRLYTTPIAMEDLDEIREALGYRRINLLGSSYGTYAAQVYLRAHPDRVRSMALIAPVPLSLSQLQVAGDAQRALDRLFADCAADPACGTAFPELPADFAAVLERLAQRPVQVEIADSDTGQPVEVVLTSEVFRVVLPYRLYSAEAASRVPRSIHLAAHGDFREMARAVLVLRRLMVGGRSRGMYLSVSCSEEPPESWDLQAVQESARGAFMGDLRVRNYMEVCALWPRGEIPRGFHEPVRSRVPALLLAGELDPAIPPFRSEEIVRQLPNSRLIVVPGSSHSPINECTAGLIRDFLGTGSAAGLDVSCVAATHRPPFVISARKDAEARRRSVSVSRRVPRALWQRAARFQSRPTLPAARGGRGTGYRSTRRRRRLFPRSRVRVPLP